MGKPLKKEREHKNKSKIGDIIFEKIEANGFVDFDENCAPRVTMNKHLNSPITITNTQNKQQFFLAVS